MDNQHKLIKGYRDLNEREIQAMNSVKEMGDRHLRMMVDLIRGLPDVDQRWISIGETHLQQGIMALVRAIARPESF